MEHEAQTCFASIFEAIGLPKSMSPSNAAELRRLASLHQLRQDDTTDADKEWDELLVHLTLAQWNANTGAEWGERLNESLELARLSMIPASNDPNYREPELSAA